MFLKRVCGFFSEDCVRDGRPALDVPDNNALYFPELLADCQNPAAPLPPSKLLEGANLEEVDLTMSTMSYVAAQAPQQPLIVERGRRGSIIGAVKVSIGRKGAAWLQWDKLTKKTKQNKNI